MINFYDSFYQLFIYSKIVKNWLLFYEPLFFPPLFLPFTIRAKYFYIKKKIQKIFKKYSKLRKSFKFDRNLFKLLSLKKSNN